MADLYEVYAHDPYGDKKIVLQGWEYFEFTQRLNSPWNHNIRYGISYEDKEGQQLVNFLRNTIDVDWHIRAFRTDPVTHQRILVYEGLNRTIVDQVKANGTILVNLYGVGYTELLSRRVVVPLSGYESSDKEGNAETIIKEYVDEQCINPVDVDRIIPGLSAEVDTFTGRSTSYSAQYTNLLSVVSKLAIDGEVDFGIVGGATVGTFALRVVPSWGLDVSVNNLNSFNPVQFDVAAGNMDIPIYSRNRSDERNVVYVGGRGEGLNRRFITRTNIRVNDSPLNRREGFLDLRNARTDGDLTTAGLDYLDKYEARETLTFNIIQTDSLRWLTHWNLGDIVTAKYFDRTFDQKINAVTVRVGTGSGQGQREYIEPEMDTLAHAWLLGVDGRTELGETTVLG